MMRPIPNRNVAAAISAAIPAAFGFGSASTVIGLPIGPQTLGLFGDLCPCSDDGDNDRLDDEEDSAWR